MAGFLKDRKQKQGLKTAICEPCAENNVKPKKILPKRLKALRDLKICKRIDGHILIFISPQSFIITHAQQFWVLK